LLAVFKPYSTPFISTGDILSLKFYEINLISCRNFIWKSFYREEIKRKNNHFIIFLLLQNPFLQESSTGNKGVGIPGHYPTAKLSL